MSSHIVIGSGPAGVACAHALLQRGKSVQLLDAGLTLEPDRHAFVEKLKQRRPEQWTSSEVAAYQAGMNASAGGLPVKLVYGSDFAYREADQHLRVHYSNVGVRASLAAGGLSNVWGAAMMPFANRDLGGWPFGTEALANHYSAVIQLIGLAAEHDTLEKFFPLYTQHLTHLKTSRQSRQLLETMERNKAALASASIHFGQSRLAVRGNKPSGEEGCIYCRLCMYGCPYGFIYSSTDTLLQLKQHPKFSYQSGVIVESARESNGSVEITGYDRQTRKPLIWEGERAFVAAGAVSTTGILLRSLGAYEQVVFLRDSQYFLVPLLLLRAIRGAQQEWLHALAQIFLEIFDPAGDDRTAHVQIYSNNDLINQAVSNAFGPLQRLLGPFARGLQERLLVAQGFLHSDHSSRIAVRLKKANGTGHDRLELEADLNPEAKSMVRKVIFKLLRHTRRIGAIPLLPMLKIAEPGRSFHTGGSFPMNQRPQGFQTDLLGRLPGWKRVHAVDATVLPSIPATTITLSVMANAHRIGWEAVGGGLEG